MRYTSLTLFTLAALTLVSGERFTVQRKLKRDDLGTMAKSASSINSDGQNQGTSAVPLTGFASKDPNQGGQTGNADLNAISSQAGGLDNNPATNKTEPAAGQNATGNSSSPISKMQGLDKAASTYDNGTPGDSGAKGSGDAGTTDRNSATNTGGDATKSAVGSGSGNGSGNAAGSGSGSNASQSDVGETGGNGSNGSGGSSGAVKYATTNDVPGQGTKPVSYASSSGGQTSNGRMKEATLNGAGQTSNGLWGGRQ